MESYLTRAEIRNNVYARLGVDSNGAQAEEWQARIHSWIDEANRALLAEFPFANAKQEAYPTVGIDQRFVNYPTGCGPDSVLAVAVWDEDGDRYLPLTRRLISPEFDDEPLAAAGGAEAEARRGTPLYWEPKSQIELWPRADQAYDLKVDFVESGELSLDTSVSKVDAELIILYALSCAQDWQGETGLAERSMGKFARRLKKLKGNQATMEDLDRYGQYSAVRNRRRRRSPVYINSGTWPVEMP